MAEPGDRDRFRPKALGNFGIVQFGIQNFDRHIAMKRLVQRPIDRTHAPAAYPVQYPVLADILPDHNGYIVAETRRGSFLLGQKRYDDLKRSVDCVDLERSGPAPKVAGSERPDLDVIEVVLDALVGRAGDDDLARSGDLVLDP